MATYYRLQEVARDATGLALPNVSVAVYIQPALTLATLFSDSAGDATLTNPLVTDGLGTVFCYVAPGLYTLTYSGPTVVTESIPDQLILGTGGTTTPIVPVVPTGVINGVGATGNRVFTLPTTPQFPSSSQLFLNGVFTTQYTLVGPTLTYTTALPPQVGDTHEIFYS